MKKFFSMGMILVLVLVSMFGVVSCSSNTTCEEKCDDGCKDSVDIGACWNACMDNCNKQKNILPIGSEPFEGCRVP